MRAASKPEKTTMPVSGERSRTTGMTSRPSRSGIERSSRTTSGRVLPTPCTASAPVPASPTTTMSGASSSAKRTSARMSGTSSATNTRIGLSLVDSMAWTGEPPPPSDNSRSEDGQVAVQLPLGDLAPIVLPLLALDLDVAVEHVLAEGAEDELGLGRELDRLA